MCGIFGIVDSSGISKVKLKFLARHAERRGKDSSGLYMCASDEYHLYRKDLPISEWIGNLSYLDCSFAMGHSRLITNGLSDNQPIYRDSICVIHNGIVVNSDELWVKKNFERLQVIDTEIIAAIVSDLISRDVDVKKIPSEVLKICKGTIACAIALPKLGKLCLFSNNGSLYFGKSNGEYYFSSEKYHLSHFNLDSIEQVREVGVFIDIPVSTEPVEIHSTTKRTKNLIPALGSSTREENLLEYKRYELVRCSKCILPETMPFIQFDSRGICNYCNNYKSRNKPKPVEELLNLIEGYRRSIGDDCIVPFSGGRDSSYALHLIVKELKMKPITYTYDWGMVTDLGRRNISRMCSMLGVENIVVADDIAMKRKNIALNLKAWLKRPNLGMVSILTAGDKHFFRHVKSVQQETGISLNLWGVNPLEVTYFKAGFLGVPPDFEETLVYSNGALKQLRYQKLRLKAMLQSPGYFNASIWDTLSGEFYRSFSKKDDYFHIYDYWRWDENLIDDTLINLYEWELSPDTNTTWRIGDGTSAFYNYIYHTIAGFSEHDTFRSNQIREGDLSREQALKLVEDENQPRYPNIKWYLDAIGLDFNEVIPLINRIQKLYPI